MSRRMGLLDEAIRDHLELRRLRGADPSEVWRAEQEAFGADDALAPPDGAVSASRRARPAEPADARGVPVFEWVESLRGAEVSAAATREPPLHASAAPSATTPADLPTAAPAPVGASPPRPQTLGEETMELDMRAVLAASEGAAPHPAVPAVAATPVRAGTEAPSASLW